MFQQVIALLFIAFFLARLFFKRQRKEISGNEFLFWLIFWILAALAIIFIKQIDAIVSSLGFSGSGIEVLLYLAVLFLFYFNFRQRLKLERIERDITRLVEYMAINKKKKNE
jgi:hypothetical protein